MAQVHQHHDIDFDSEFEQWKTWKQEVDKQHYEEHLQKLKYMFSEHQLNVLANFFRSRSFDFERKFNEELGDYISALALFLSKWCIYVGTGLHVFYCTISMTSPIVKLPLVVLSQTHTFKDCSSCFDKYRV